MASKAKIEERKGVHMLRFERNETMIEELRAFCDKMTRIAARAQELSPQRSLLDLPNRQNRAWDALDGARVACKDVASTITRYLPELEAGKGDRESLNRFVRSHLKYSYDDAVMYCYGSSIAAAKVRVYDNLFKRLERLNRAEEKG
jgi:hypothetical protein